MKINVTAKMKNYFIILTAITIVFAREQCPNNRNKVCGSNPRSCSRCKYRSYDGSCNNLIHPSWGTANKEYGRFTPAFYADGIYAFPRSITGQPLMNPRDISLKVFPDKFCLDKKWTIITMQWGQFLAHDMSLTKDVPQTRENRVVCCTNGEPIPPRAYTHPRCAPIPIPKDDPYKAPEGQTCINFYRTKSNADENCTVSGKAIRPLSEVTSFIDLSLVYGNHKNRAHQIRTHVGGRLISVRRNRQYWLPQNPNSTFACETRNPREPCYYSGDDRVNQNPELSILHTLIFRYHNLVAKQLCDVINPHWNDERCYQETRRILIAISQKITYYDFLPIFIGLKNMVKMGLVYPNAKGYINDYNPNVNPQVLTEHATAAWRFFHTLMVGSLEKFSPARCSTGHIRLSDWFNKPSIIEDYNNFCELTIGLATQHQMASDRFFSPEISQNLFRPLTCKSCTDGGDLRAIDIMRSRDHGVGKYVDCLVACGQPRPRCFADLEKYITPARVKLLRRVYKSVEDVELPVGAALEPLVTGTITPATFLCIITKQFYKTRVGDRFFFENGGDDGSFTLDQLKSIRKFTMSRLLCDTVKCLTRIQKDAFLTISGMNPLVDCKTLPEIDLTLWKEEKCPRK